MVYIKPGAFRAWVVNRFDTMAEDSSWQRDNPALVNQARRIAHSLNHDQPISRADAKAVVEEAISFEDVLRTVEYKAEWRGCKDFLIDVGEVREMAAIDELTYVSRGSVHWFKYRGKKWIDRRQ